MRTIKNSFLALNLAIITAAAGCGGGGSKGGGGGAAADTTKPTVVSTNPINTATGIFTNAKITAIFSEGMAPATFNTTTFTLKQGITAIPGTVTFANRTAVFDPTAILSASLLYTATITTGAKDLAGNALAANKVWTFTTGTAQDTTAPTVLSTDPADAGLDVASNRNVTATFSEAIDPATVVTAFTLKATATGTPVAGTASGLGSAATFNPTSNLANGTQYTASIATSVTDLAGVALAATKEWTFTTGVVAAKGPAPVLLGTAGNFVILAKSGISTVPSSAIVGDIGVSPIDQTAITGFSETQDSTTTFSTSGQVTGKIFAADYTSPTPSNLTTAVSDMEIAYTDAAGRSNPDFTEFGAGEIGGKTLAPGLYKWGTDVLISTNVTLAGNANDVWIFQIGGGITQANGTRVNMSGALPKNVFWQSAGSVEIGTTAHFEGVILSQTSINLGTGASANSRLLAQTAVTLDQNAVTKPAN